MVPPWSTAGVVLCPDVRHSRPVLCAKAALFLDPHDGVHSRARHARLHGPRLQPILIFQGGRGHAAPCPDRRVGADLTPWLFHLASSSLHGYVDRRLGVTLVEKGLEGENRAMPRPRDEAFEAVVGTLDERWRAKERLRAAAAGDAAARGATQDVAARSVSAGNGLEDRMVPEPVRDVMYRHASPEDVTRSLWRSSAPAGRTCAARCG